jgi:2-oxoisovalerate dehydrogenase E1 component subunit alpha
MRTIVERFEISHRRLLDPAGRPVGDGVPALLGSPEAMCERLRAMVRTRLFDTRAVELQRAGQLGTYASSLGQEAVAVGVASAMHPEDVLVPSFREHGAQLLRGVTIRELLLYWGGDERGCDFAGPREDFPVCIPVGSHAPHAAGVALALQMRRESRVAVCMLGDGATSKGDFYEALNVSGVWRLPVVFVVMNNEWAISVPRRAQTAAPTLAQKAAAAGLPGEQVDGNDVLAVEQAASEAILRARDGQGASLIEALTYRMADHTTSDDARRYRGTECVEAHRDEDPILRLRLYLESRGLWSPEDHERLEVESRAEIEREVETYLAASPQAPDSMFNHLYEKLPRALEDQRTRVRTEFEPDG